MFKKIQAAYNELDQGPKATTAEHARKTLAAATRQGTNRHGNRAETEAEGASRAGKAAEEEQSRETRNNA